MISLKTYWCFDQEARGAACGELRASLSALATQPRALSLLCRLAVRARLGPGGQRRVNQLPRLPRKIKNFISLRDLYSA